MFCDSQPVSDFRTAQTGLTPQSLAGGMYALHSQLYSVLQSAELRPSTAPAFVDVQQHVATLIRGKIIIGYALWQFLSVRHFRLASMVVGPNPGRQVMGLSHPAIDTRDTALFLPFRRSLHVRSNAIVPLMTLVNRLMAREFGVHGEFPVRCMRVKGGYMRWLTMLRQTEEARASLDLFRSCEQVWEGIVSSGSWPCALPPEAYANCFT